MSKRIQFYFPEDLYLEAETVAKKEGKSMAEIVREALKKYLSEHEKKTRNKWKNDPLKKGAGFFEGSEDLSQNIDEYIYGKESD
jgi:Arc/MetJ-type ribon-helix-helix transcriptional regulator